MAFLMNFLVTAYTCITFGISCIPFKANWDSIPDSKCFSKEVLAITNQINAGRSSLSDFDWDSWFLLKSHSSCVRMRHRHGLDTPVSAVGCTDEGAN